MIATQIARWADELISVDLWLEAPTCPVNWRWRRAEWRRLSRSKFRLDQDDDWIKRAIRGQRWIEREKLANDPDLVRAWELSQPDDWTRAELEARILANQPFPEISAVMKIPETVVEAYEALFFDVLRRLKATSWIFHFVLGSKTWQPLQPQDAKWLWRCLGFTFGVHAVDEMVNRCDREKLEILGVPYCWSKESRLSMEMQYALISRAIPNHGIKTLKYLVRFIGAGLCEGTPIHRPPADLSLTMGGDELWGDALTPMRVKETKWKAAKVA